MAASFIALAGPIALSIVLAVPTPARADYLEGYVCQLMHYPAASSSAWGASGSMLVQLYTRPSCGGGPVRDLGTSPIFATTGGSACFYGTYALTAAELSTASAALRESIRDRTAVWVNTWDRCVVEWGVRAK
jgi:hypothetical protein